MPLCICYRLSCEKPGFFSLKFGDRKLHGGSWIDVIAILKFEEGMEQQKHIQSVPVSLTAPCNRRWVNKICYYIQSRKIRHTLTHEFCSLLLDRCFCIPYTLVQEQGRCPKTQGKTVSRRLQSFISRPSGDYQVWQDFHAIKQSAKTMHAVHYDNAHINAAGGWYEVGKMSFYYKVRDKKRHRHPDFLGVRWESKLSGIPGGTNLGLEVSGLRKTILLKAFKDRFWA